MRLTVARRWVVEQMCLLKQPFTADELYEACSEKRIVKATIYNTIELMKDAQLLHTNYRDVGHPVTDYELMAGTWHRMQFICQKCGRPVDFRDKSIDALLKKHKFPNFNMLNYSLFVYGECKTCRGTKRRNQK